MGGTSSTDKNVDTLFSTFNTQTQKDVDRIITILNNIVATDIFSLDNELLLGQMFTSISQRVTNLKSQLVFYKEKIDEKEESNLILSAIKFGETKLIKFITFFENIEWCLSDIKISKYPGKNSLNIIKKIQAFMQTSGNFHEISSQFQETQITFSPKVLKKFEGREEKEQRIKELKRKLQVVHEQIEKYS